MNMKDRPNTRVSRPTVSSLDKENTCLNKILALYTCTEDRYIHITIIMSGHGTNVGLYTIWVEHQIYMNY